jgi:hypothetical protein
VPIGNCRMCLQKKSLVKSHLMPAALYDYCRKGEHRPIKVGGGFVIPTDRQTQDFLLCEDCEDVLNSGGERWTLDKLATWERTFPLYDLLTKVPPLFDEDGMAVYLAVQNREIEVEKLTHFALGLFWKASVYSWRGDTTYPRIDLGPYSEEIREWLRGRNAFPKYVFLIVVIEKPQKAQITMNDPYEGVRQGWRTHFVHVPGVLFMMALGKTVDDSVRALSITNAGNPINVSDPLTENFEKLMVQTLRKSHKTQAYLRAKAKADADRKTQS